MSRAYVFVVWLAGVILAGMIIAALLGPILTPYDAAAQNLLSRLLPPGASGPDGSHWFGTDALGRDILSLIIFGDLLLSLTNIQLAFPFFLLAVTVVGILRPSTSLVIAVIALGSWVPFARVTYADTQQLRELEFIEAVRVMRGSNIRILFRHILPNVLPNVVVLCTFAIGTAIVMESGLSFVGLGVPSETPTWGRMLSEGRDYMDSAWWLTVFPGAAILLLVLVINVIGEQLRDYADPRVHTQ